MVFIGAGLPAEAAFMSGTTGARPLAMGNAYVGLSDDGAGIFINPAALTGLKGINLISTYNEPMTDTLYTALGVAAPSWFDGVVGLGYRNKMVSNLPASTEIVSLTDQEILLAYSMKFSESMALGADIRFLSRGLSKTVAGYEGLNGSGTAYDLSVKYDYSPRLSAGVALQNLGGEVKYQDNTSENIDRNFIAGVSFKGLEGKSRVNLDVSSVSAEPLLMHVGIEWQVSDLLAVRAGINQTPKSSTEIYNNLTAGLGFLYQGITFDYAIYKQGDPSGATSNYFSLGYVGPKPRPPVKVQPTPEAGVPPSMMVAKVKRVTFSDLPKKFWATETIELLATAGLITGYPDGAFRPKQKVTRGEFVKMLATAKHLSPSSIFRPEKPIMRKDAAKLMGIGKISRPGDHLTRAELAKLFYDAPFGQAALKRLPALEP